MLLRPPPLKGDWKVADTPQTIARKRADYLQLMRKARQANDPVLVKMLVKKLAGLGMVNAVSTVGGCTVIPFPTIQTAATPSTPEQPPVVGADKADPGHSGQPRRPFYAVPLFLRLAAVPTLTRM